MPSPGVAEGANPVGPGGGELLVGLPDYQFFDSLAVDGDGWVCVATLVNGGITSVSPDGSTIEHFATDDPLTTNICFGGPDLRTAYITCSGSGRLTRHGVAAPGAAARLPRVSHDDPAWLWPESREPGRHLREPDRGAQRAVGAPRPDGRARRTG